MTAPVANGYALCFTGARSLNKRMSLFVEGVLAAGGAACVVALPRGQWSIQRFESMQANIAQSRLSLKLQMNAKSSLKVIFCFHWLVLPFAVVVGLIRRVPVVYDEHDHYEVNTLESNGGAFRRWFSSRLIRLIHRTMLPFVSMVTCIHMANDALKRHLQQWQPCVLELHNFPVAAWRDACQESSIDSKLCFIYMGGVFAEKGVGKAADAFQQLPTEIRNNCELHIFGSGDTELLSQLQQMPDVVVHNSQSPQQLRHFASLRRCCGLVLYAEHPRYRLIGTNSRKLYEYLALGMPVISTTVGELPQFLTEHRVGLLIDAAIDVQELTGAMQQLAESKTRWRELSENARRLMLMPEMTWEHEWGKVVNSGVLNELRRAA